MIVIIICAAAQSNVTVIAGVVEVLVLTVAVGQTTVVTDVTLVCIGTGGKLEAAYVAEVILIFISRAGACLLFTEITVVVSVEIVAFGHHRLTCIAAMVFVIVKALVGDLISS